MDNAEFLKILYKKAHALRTPLYASIELTKRCNLGCKHCYLQGLPAGGEIDAFGWMALLQHLEKAGCLQLLLTGGEPLLRTDFDVIYLEACNLGLLVSVFTNATLVTNSIIRLFERHPPYEIETTLLGARPATHDALTGTAGSFDKTIQAIHQMRACGLNINLKTVVMRSNLNQVQPLQELAHRLGCGFRFDPAIFARLNGDPVPRKLRITAWEALALDCLDQRRIDSWMERSCKNTQSLKTSSLYTCAAGITKCHLSAEGQLYPCILSTHSLGDLSRYPFDALWKNAKRIWQKILSNTGPSPCLDCVSRTLCPTCPAMNKLECGQEEIPSDFFCTIGKQRWLHIEKLAHQA